MECDLKLLNSNLRNALSAFISNSEVIGDFRENCLNLIESIYILKKLIRHKIHKKNLIEEYNGLLNILNCNPGGNSQSDIEAKMNGIIEMFINYVGVLFSYDPYQIKSVINRARENFSKFTSILSYFICSIFELNIEKDIQFDLSWNIYLKDTLLSLGIITSNSIPYAKSLAYSILVQEPNNELLGVVDGNKIQDFSRFLFEEVSNLKFFIKASKIYSEFIIQLNGVNDEIIIETLNFRCTSAQNVEFDNTNPKNIIVGEVFNLFPNGSEKSRRYDFISLFGKHPHCDFLFPKNAQGIEDISFAIYHTKMTYYIIDCSKKSQLKYKLEPQHFFKLHAGLLLDISEKAIMKILNIHFRDQDIPQDAISFLDYEFITGELSHRLVSNVKTLRASQNKSEFILGRGGLGVNASILFVEEAKVSRTHLVISFKDCKWTVCDTNSSHGTFILFKSFTEYSSCKYSSCSRLFNKIEEGINFLTLRFEGYTLFFTQN